MSEFSDDEEDDLGWTNSRRVKMKKRPIVLDDRDMERLIPLLESAIREANESLLPDARIRPDYPGELVESLMWAEDLLRRIETSNY